MSNRVVLGNLGGGDYGLRVSKPGSDAINNNGSQVSVDNLIFDSTEPIGHLPLWRYYRRQIPGATFNSSSGTYSLTLFTISFGTTLPFPPLVYGFKEVSGGMLSIYGYHNIQSSGPDEFGFTYYATDSEIVINHKDPSSAWYRFFVIYEGTV
jgi:hypothetical protein